MAASSANIVESGKRRDARDMGDRRVVSAKHPLQAKVLLRCDDRAADNLPK